jgi:serine/threonine protein kinase
MAQEPRKPSDELPPGSQIGDHFVVRRRLGVGGMGEVYLAENTNLRDLQCAVKILRPELSDNEEFVESLKAEAGRQSRLKHDNVVQIYDFFEWRGRYYLFQGYISGKTLSEHIAQSPSGLPLHDALTWISEILAGLDYAHQTRGVLHCDIKPSNIIVDEMGRPRITDFGIARDLGASSGPDANVPVGTPEYMSPEQITAPATMDHRTDVYSTGVMLFEMLSGRLPFERPPSSGNFFPQLLTDPPDIRRFRADIPETVARIILTAMQPDRERRFPSCVDFRRAIVKYLRDKRWREVWLPIIAVASVVAGAIGLGLWYWYTGQRNLVVEKTRNVEISKAAESMLGAATSLNLLCREAKAREAKARGVGIAEGMGEVDVARQLKSQVQDMDSNIDTDTQIYLNDIRQLLPSARAVVDSAESASLKSQASAQTHSSIEIVMADYQSLHAGSGPSSRADMIRHCPQVTAGQPDQH